MFGPFRITNPLSGGLLWKIPWRLSKFQKRRHRMRLRAVDNVVATVDAALAKKGETLEALERWKAEMPTEAEMLPKDKYTVFDRKAKRYRKGIHRTFPRVPWRDGLDTDEFVCRGSQVDEGVATSQPPRLLRGPMEAKSEFWESIASWRNGTTWPGRRDTGYNNYVYNILFDLWDTGPLEGIAANRYLLDGKMKSMQHIVHVFIEAQRVERDDGRI